MYIWIDSGIILHCWSICLGVGLYCTQFIICFVPTLCDKKGLTRQGIGKDEFPVLYPIGYDSSRQQW